MDFQSPDRIQQKNTLSTVKPNGINTCYDRNRAYRCGQYQTQPTVAKPAMSNKHNETADYCY